MKFFTQKSRRALASVAAAFALLFCCFSSRAADSTAVVTPPVLDTVKTGIYITSIHDINFKEKEYTIYLWIWFRYRNRKFDFVQNLEIPEAKSVNKSFISVDSSGEKVYVLMKLQCVMKDQWKILNFPFDKQKLRLTVENSQFDSKALVFECDTMGKNFDPKFALRGWQIDSLRISTSKRVYETNFGDANILQPQTEYSAYKMKMQISREVMGLFWKMFLGMYVAFLIAFMCFYIHPDHIDSRFALSVGALFAVVGNKYIVDSSLPETSSFTLVDLLHGITLFYVLGIIVSVCYTLSIMKKGDEEKAHRFDKRCARIIMATYILLNIVCVCLAVAETN